jgi:hypothetical protein
MMIPLAPASKSAPIKLLTQCPLIPHSLFLILTMPLVGNFSQNPIFDSVDHLPPGYRMFMLTGTARITTTPGIVFPILDRFEQPLIVPGTATEPSWMSVGDYNLARALTGTANGDVLKLGTGAVDATNVLGNSTPVAANLLAIQQVRTVGATPYTVFPQIVAPTTFGLFLHNGANLAPAGTLALPVVAGQPSFLRIPVRLVFMRRMPAVSLNEIQLSIAAQRLDAGIVG